MGDIRTEKRRPSSEFRLPRRAQRRQSAAGRYRVRRMLDTAFSVRGDRNRLRLVKPKHTRRFHLVIRFVFLRFSPPSVPENVVRADLGRAREQWTTVPLRRLRDRNYSVFFRRNRSHGSRRPKNETRVRSADQQYRPCSTAVVFTIIDSRDEYDYNRCKLEFQQRQKTV